MIPIRHNLNPHLKRPIYCDCQHSEVLNISLPQSPVCSPRPTLSVPVVDTDRLTRAWPRVRPLSEA